MSNFKLFCYSDFPFLYIHKSFLKMFFYIYKIRFWVVGNRGYSEADLKLRQNSKFFEFFFFFNFYLRFEFAPGSPISHNWCKERNLTAVHFDIPSKLICILAFSSISIFTSFFMNETCKIFCVAKEKCSSK